jgi:hypothetical protein
MFLNTALVNSRLTVEATVSSTEEIETAEAKMNLAKDALLNYIERQKTIDRDLHRRLVARLKKAQVEFLRAISELGE